MRQNNALNNYNANIRKYGISKFKPSIDRPVIIQNISGIARKNGQKNWVNW